MRFPLIPARNAPLRRDRADNSLSPGVDVNVLDSDLLLAFAAVTVEGLDQGRIGARQLIGLGKVLAASLERLFANHGAPIALHCGVMGGDELRRQ